MRPIHGKDFLAWLQRGGLVPENTRRVVIEASVDRSTVIYVETFASHSMIEVEIPTELRVARTETLP